MGVLSDLKAAPKSFATRGKVVAELDRLIAKKQDNVEATAAAVNAVHTVNQFASDPSAGTFTLTVTLANGETFTTAGIAYNAVAATIETAIDTAASGVTGWTNGDISVTGGNLLAAGADVVLTFDGASVAGANHALTTIDGSGLTGGSLAAPATVKTTAGQTGRNGWGALVSLGIVGTPLPAQGEARPEDIVAGSGLLRVPSWLVKELAQEAAVEDGDNATYHAIMTALYGRDKTPLVQQDKTSSGF